MCKFNKYILYCGLLSLLLSACTSLAKAPPSSPTPRTSQKATLTAVSAATAQEAATASTVNPMMQPSQAPEHSFELMDPTSDGKLRLIIQEQNNECYKPGSQVLLTATYENLTGLSLRVVDFSAVSANIMKGSKGQLFPYLATTDRKRVFSPQEFYLVQVFNPESPVYYTIPQNDKLDVAIETYYLPSEIVSNNNPRKGEVESLQPGNYILQLVYFAHKDADNKFWSGEISSNHINICVTN